MFELYGDECYFCLLNLAFLKTLRVKMQWSPRHLQNDIRKSLVVTCYVRPYCQHQEQCSQPRLRGTLGLRRASLVIQREMVEYVYTNFDVCVTVHHWCNNINSQIWCKNNNFINSFNYSFNSVPPHPGHHQTASSVLYTTSCKDSLVLLRMGEIIARNMLSWLKLLIKLLLLHIVGCLY